MPDGLNMLPRPKEPESAMESGMAAPRAQRPRTAPETAPGEQVAAAPGSIPNTSGPGPTPLQVPASWSYDFDPANGSSRAVYNGEVSFTSGGSGTAGVASFNARTGAVTLTPADLASVGGAPLTSPALTGTPTAPTATPGDADTSIATTAFVAQAIAAAPAVASFNTRTGAVALSLADVVNAGGAPLASPNFTGTPQAPTPTLADQSSKLATTQFVANVIAGGTVTKFNGRQGIVALSLSDVLSVGGAPIASPNFTGTPTVPTASPGTATTQAASTAFVTDAITSGTAGVSSFNTRTGAILLQLADVIGVGGAPILSPNFTGNPAAPTPTAGDSSTKIATTAFVGTAIAAAPVGVATFNGRSGVVTQQLADITSVGGAPIASPTFTGNPAAPTPTAGDNSTKLATTAFVDGGIAAGIAAITGYAHAGANSDITSLAGLTTPLSIAQGGTSAVTAPAALAALGGQPILGVTNGSNAAAGQIGEYFAIDIPSNSPTNLTSAATIAISSFILAAGDWDVWVCGAFIGDNSTSVQQLSMSIAIGSPGTNLNNGFNSQNSYFPAITPFGNGKLALDVGPARVNITATTNLYLMAYANFAVSTCAAFGIMQARRRR